MGPGCEQAGKLTVTDSAVNPFIAIVIDDQLSDAYSHLTVEVLPRIVRSDPKLVAEIKAFGGDLQFADNAFQFTLPALFQFVCQSFARNSGHQIEASRENYLRFRKLLYSNPTNSRLRQLGGQIEIASADPKHELSVYKLVTFIR